MWQNYYQPTSLEDMLALMAAHPEARLVAGGSDVLVELSRRVNPTETLIDLTRIDTLRYLHVTDGIIRIGALATHNQVIASEACVAGALPLAQACWEVGAPQIRTRATIAGNLVTASPANDTIAPLLALDAELELRSADGSRVLTIGEFYLGFRRTALRPGELLSEIRVPMLRANQRGTFIKLGLRRAQAISVINLAVVLSFQGEDPSLPIESARIALGCVAPTVVRATQAEDYLRGRTLDAETIAEAGRLALAAAAPIDDVRGSAGYRRETVVSLVSEALRRIASGTERETWPAQPVLLEADVAPLQASLPGDTALPFAEAQVNGTSYQLASDKTLLDALREDAGLTGSKEGCAEGECGACTVWINGQAVMACLVPAAQAHGATITTIEGLAAHGAPADTQGALHPLQAAFISNGAVQCGYCIPGMLMAGAKLLDEHAQPSLPQVQAALSGNICRCTGYRKILAAVMEAAEQGTP